MIIKEQVTKVITGQGILPLYFNPDETVSIGVLRAIHSAGVCPGPAGHLGGGDLAGVGVRLRWTLAAVQSLVGRVAGPSHDTITGLYGARVVRVGRRAEQYRARCAN